jgi:hypothetical protein
VRDQERRPHDKVEHCRLLRVAEPAQLPFVLGASDAAGGNGEIHVPSSDDCKPIKCQGDFYEHVVV